MVENLLPDSRRVLPALALLLLIATLASAAPEDQPATSSLVFHGDALLEKIDSLGEQDFRFSLEVENPTEAKVAIEAANLLLAHEGGWLSPLDPDPMDGTFFRGSWDVPASERHSVGSWSYRSLSPATHALLSVRAADGVAQVPVPILRPELDTKRAYEVQTSFGVGVVGPLELLSYSDGRRSVVLVGQHQALDGGTPEDVRTSVYVGDDAGASDPSAWKGLEGRDDRVALWPFVRRVDVYPGFERGWLRIDATATVEGTKRSFSRVWPVAEVTPTPVLSPVLGAWQLGNGPGQSDIHAHYGRPDHRYAYDMVVVENGRTHRGDPHENSSYFAWDGSIRAVADGVVVDVCDREPDNPGYRGSLSDCFNNRIVLKHPNGVHTAYLHIRQRSSRVREGNSVRAGQVIGNVGNSGNSAEPHLHFQAFTLDEAGRHKAIPVTFTNAFHDAGSKQKVAGVAVGGRVYYFKR